MFPPARLLAKLLLGGPHQRGGINAAGVAGGPTFAFQLEGGGGQGIRQRQKPADALDAALADYARYAKEHLGAHRLSGDVRYAERLRAVLAWLEAFAGQQPHCRLRSVPIRHWDGYWFGRERLWGDVFPHYWSVLSASVFLRAGALFPDRREHYRRLADDLYRAHLLHYTDDGGATCAFVFPSAVDGRPAHRPDPLANDQDWALVWLLNDMARPEAGALIPFE